MVLSSRTFSAQRAYHDTGYSDISDIWYTLFSLDFATFLKLEFASSVHWSIGIASLVQCLFTSKTTNQLMPRQLQPPTWKIPKVVVFLSCRSHVSFCLLSDARSSLISHMAMSCCKDSCLACAKERSEEATASAEFLRMEQWLGCSPWLKCTSTIPRKIQGLWRRNFKSWAWFSWKRIFCRFCMLHPLTANSCRHVSASSLLILLCTSCRAACAAWSEANQHKHRSTELFNKQRKHQSVSKCANLQLGHALT